MTELVPIKFRFWKGIFMGSDVKTGKEDGLKGLSGPTPAPEPATEEGKTMEPKTLKITAADVKDGRYIGGEIDFDGNVEIDGGLGHVFFCAIEVSGWLVRPCPVR